MKKLLSPLIIFLAVLSSSNLVRAERLNLVTVTGLSPIGIKVIFEAASFKRSEAAYKALNECASSGSIDCQIKDTSDLANIEESILQNL